MSIGSVSSSSPLYGVNAMLRPAKPTEEEQAAEFAKNDVDQSGGLSKDEFTAMHAAMGGEEGTQSAGMDKLKDAIFGMFDVDGDGEVTGEELEVGRTEMIAKLEGQYGGKDTMAQMNDVLDQTQQTLLDMMNSNSDKDDDDDTFDFLNNNYSAKIQAYLDQSDKGKDADYSADAINSLLNTGSISDYI